MNVKILKILKEDAPYDLLLLADPSVELLKKYLDVSQCYAAYLDKDMLRFYLNL